MSKIDEPVGTAAPVTRASNSQTTTRMHGSLIFLAGALLIPVTFGVAYIFSRLVGSAFGAATVHISGGFVCIPFVVSLIGLFEFLSGISFRRLQELYDGPIVQLGLARGLMLTLLLLMVVVIGFLGVGALFSWSVQHIHDVSQLPV